MFKKKKRYCNNCRFLEYWTYDFSNIIKWRGCTHPDNLIRKDTPEKPNFSVIKTISQLNKNNDCKWYRYDLGEWVDL